MRLLPPSALSHRRAAVSACREGLYRVAFSWCHDAALAEDLAQEALARALARVGQIRDEKALRSWVYSILTNVYRDDLRRRRATVDVAELQLAGRDDPGQEADYQDLLRRVGRAMAALPAGQRQVLSLVELAGLSYAEVAASLEIPAGTVMSRLHRARARVREQVFTGQDTVSALRMRRVK